MTDCNQDLLLAARGLVKSENNPAHWSAIDAGKWDGFGAMESAMERLLKSPPKDGENE